MRKENPVERNSEGVLYLGSAIRDLRLQSGISLLDLAREVDLSVGALSKIETNGAAPSTNALSKIGSRLGIPADFIAKAPLHPRIVTRREKRANQYLPIGERVAEIIAASDLPESQMRFVEEVIVDFSISLCNRLKKSQI